MNSEHSTPIRRRGVSLVEIVVALAIMASLMTLFLAAFVQSDDIFWDESNRARFEMDTADLVDWFTNELRASSPDTFDPADPVSEDLLKYRVVTGTDVDGTAIWSGDRQISFVLDVGEVDNGLDDDGDGFIDEGRIAFYDDDTGDTTYLRGVVPLNSFDLTQDGSSLDIRMGLYYQYSGALRTEFVEFTVGLRNTGTGP